MEENMSGCFFSEHSVDVTFHFQPAIFHADWLADGGKHGVRD